MAELASEDIVYGTRALSLTMPNDVVVPSDRAGFPEESNRVVGPEGWNGHAGIVRSRLARGLAHAFLRGAPASCIGGWDVWGPRLGAAVGWLESGAAEAVGAAESGALGRALGAGKGRVDAGWRGVRTP
jgi:hypothetical protein